MQTFLDIPVRRERLAACLHTPAGAALRPAPVVVCCHGLTGTRVGTCYRFVSLARRLEEAGLACLRFDFRGCGESDGRFEDVTADSLLNDLRAVLSFLVGRRDLDASRIALVGSSFGAYTASRAVPEIRGLRALVYYAPVADPRAIIDRDVPPAGRELLRRQGWLEHFGLRLGRAFFETLPAADVPRMLAGAARPLLIFHARRDPHIPIDQGERYEKALREAGVEARLVALEADDHAMRSVAANERMIDGTIEWVRRFVAGAE